MSEKELDWFQRHRIITVCVTLLIVWSSLLVWFVLQGNAITNDPCSVCAEKMGEDVYCSMQSGIPITRIYHVNGSIVDNTEEIRALIDEQIGKQDSFVDYGDVNFSDVFG